MSAPTLTEPAPARLAVGVDPGPTPGFVALLYKPNRIVQASVVQCTADVAEATLLMLLGTGAWPYEGRPLVQIERFVVGARAARSSSASAGATTRDMVAVLQSALLTRDVASVVRSASAVKPWATDERLERAGLLELTKGMRHSRDAARHALFTAVREGGLTDPISKEWNR